MDHTQVSETPRAAVAPSVRHIAIAGNPNCGKSTIFNALTGLRQKVGNYPGVTVERKTGRFFGTHGEPMVLVDLPGSYSLQVHSADEAVARDVLLGRADMPRPEAVVVVVDASNLERNLYLAAQLLDLQIPMVLALNMVDVAEQNGTRIDKAGLEREFGVPVIPMVASKGVGLLELKQALSREVLPAPDKRPPVPEAIEKEARELAKRLRADQGSPFSEALLLLTLQESGLEELARHEPSLLTPTMEAQARLRQAGVEPLSAMVEARYGWIGELCARVVHQAGTTEGLTLSDRIDLIVTHRVWGWVAFLGVMALMFFCIFTVAQYPMEWIEGGFGWLSEQATALIPAGHFQSLLTDGVIAGVGGVVVFLPQILILYFFLGLLEDSGYMARAAFMMDRVMASVGLHGKSFIPLLSSFACAIPGIMASRTIENRKDRLVTILVAPLMSCPARLPVYALMIAVMMPIGSAAAKAGIMLSMYLLGTVMAFLMAWIFKKTLLKSEKPMLLLELPPYRMPALKSIGLRMWERSGIFLRRAGTVILSFSVILWALLKFPEPANPEVSKAEAISQSYAGQLGHFIEPVIRPLGYDWKIGIGIIGSFAAREVFVGTMAIVYNLETEEAAPAKAEDGGKPKDEAKAATGETAEGASVDKEEKEKDEVRDAMLAEKRADGTPVFTPLVCVSLMVYYVLAMQCLATVAVVRRETNSWRWPLFQVAYMSILAWGASFVVFQAGRLLGF
ncbi:MAG: ferrous iron transport protein B [Chthoniobacteraceae bacterium]